MMFIRIVRFERLQPQILCEAVSLPLNISFASPACYVRRERKRWGDEKRDFTVGMLYVYLDLDRWEVEFSRSETYNNNFQGCSFRPSCS